MALFNQVETLMIYKCTRYSIDTCLLSSVETIIALINKTKRKHSISIVDE